MAHKKGGGSSRNGRDSNSKRLGVKAFGGETVPPAPSSCASAAPGSTPATASGKGSDDTLFALRPGVVEFHDSRGRKFASVAAEPSSRSAGAASARRSPSTHAWIARLWPAFVVVRYARFVRMCRRLDVRRNAPNGPIGRPPKPLSGSDRRPGSGGRSGGGCEK